METRRWAGVPFTLRSGKALKVDSAEIVMDNPLGGIKRGWHEVRSVYERLFSGPARVLVEFHDYVQPNLALAQGALDAARRFVKEQIFRVGVQVIEGVAKPDAAGPAFARIAECVVNGLLVTKGRVAPFIVTLGTMTVARGLAMEPRVSRPSISSWQSWARARKSWSGRPSCWSNAMHSSS